jgi:hypothetical protein
MFSIVNMKIIMNCLIYNVKLIPAECYLTLKLRIQTRLHIPLNNTLLPSMSYIVVQA